MQIQFSKTDFIKFVHTLCHNDNLGTDAFIRKIRIKQLFLMSMKVKNFYGNNHVNINHHNIQFAMEINVDQPTNKNSVKMIESK